MIKVEVIINLLRSLQEQNGNLRRLQSLSVKELTDDFVKWNALLHLLQVSVEHVTDASAHLLAGTGRAVPDNHRHMIQKLGEVGILPYELAQRIALMAGFRNIVVHHYLSVDPQTVADLLHNRLDDFDEFISHVYSYLRHEGHIS